MPVNISRKLNEPLPRNHRTGGEEARGTVSRVITSKDDGWGAVVLSTDEGEVKAAGSVAHLRPGDAVVLGGEWTTHPRWGRQLKVTSCRVERPSSAAGIERYLEGVGGVGPVTARAICRAFGDDALRVIEEEPARLAAVEGVGPVRAEAIVTAVRNRQATDDLAISLGAAGVPARFVAAIVKRWGVKAPEIVRQRPYSLIGAFEGIGFKTADVIARAAGIPLASEERVCAGVLHVLSEAAGGVGHTLLPRAKLLAEAARLLELKMDTIAPSLMVLDNDGLIVLESDEVFTRRLHGHEAQVAQRLLRIAETPCRPMAAEGQQESRPDAEVAELSPEQAEALAVVEEGGSVLILNGGPGTGKTFLTNLITRRFIRAGLRVRLAAPTGKAARRLSEATGEPAETIHRLLEYSPIHGGFTRTAERPLEADVVIVDETSMVDVSLMRHLLVAVPDAARLILVGDADQLPSVGPGRVLADAIASGVLRAVRLKQVFRQAAESRIVLNAHRINRGEPFELAADGAPSDFYFTEREDPGEVAALVVQLVQHRIPEVFGLDPRSEVQVLTPMNRGLIGSRELNRHLQAALNPDGRPTGRGGLRVGDRVMQLRNNYNLDVMNGDAGQIVDYAESHPGHSGVAVTVVDFGDGRLVEMENSDTGDLALAYASSVHKFQGSEIPAVVLVVHSSHWIMLQRNLVYTGITRARKLLCIVGETKAVRQAARSAHGQERYSRLATRLRQPGYGRAPRVSVSAEFIKTPRWTCGNCGNQFNARNPTACPECGGEELGEERG